MSAVLTEEVIALVCLPFVRPDAGYYLNICSSGANAMSFCIETITFQMVLLLHIGILSPTHEHFSLKGPIVWFHNLSFIRTLNTVCYLFNNKSLSIGLPVLTLIFFILLTLSKTISKCIANLVCVKGKIPLNSSKWVLQNLCHIITLDVKSHFHATTFRFEVVFEPGEALSFSYQTVDFPAMYKANFPWPGGCYCIQCTSFSKSVCFSPSSLSVFPFHSNWWTWVTRGKVVHL